MDDEQADLRKAHVDTRESFQRLTFMLEKKGILTADELAVIYGEQEPPTYNRQMKQR